VLAGSKEMELCFGHSGLPRAVFGGVYHIRYQCNNPASHGAQALIRDPAWLCLWLLSNARRRTIGSDTLSAAAHSRL